MQSPHVAGLMWAQTAFEDDPVGYLQLAQQKGLLLDKVYSARALYQAYQAKGKRAAKPPAMPSRKRPSRPPSSSEEGDGDDSSDGVASLSEGEMQEAKKVKAKGKRAAKPPAKLPDSSDDDSSDGDDNNGGDGKMQEEAVEVECTGNLLPTSPATRYPSLLLILATHPCYSSLLPTSAAIFLHLVSSLHAQPWPQRVKRRRRRIRRHCACALRPWSRTRPRRSRG